MSSVDQTDNDSDDTKLTINWAQFDPQLVSRAHTIVQRWKAVIKAVVGRGDFGDDDQDIGYIESKYFNPPATQDQLNELQSHYTLPIPEQFKILYLLHNGENNNNGIIWGNVFLSINRTIAQKRVINEDWKLGKIDKKHGVPSIPWSKDWIPFALTGSGDCTCIDLAPQIENGGIPGQIHQHYHDDDYFPFLGIDLFTTLECWLNSIDLQDENFNFYGIDST